MDLWYIQVTIIWALSTSVRVHTFRCALNAMIKNDKIKEILKLFLNDCMFVVNTTHHMIVEISLINFMIVLFLDTK